MKILNRRNFVIAAGWILSALLLSSGQGVGETVEKKPNVLLYVVDDQGTNDAGCYGNPVIKTPGLDSLAREGVRFTNAFCTTASCAASRSVILSGLYSHANGMYGHSHACHHFQCFDNFKGLPVLLGEAGYRTTSAGKYHVAPESVFQFDSYIRGSSPREMAEKVRPFIASESDSPFFLYFCTTEPHRPFKREGFDPIDPKDVIVPPYLPDSPECRQELAKYYMSVQRADSGLLRLIEILKETGHYADTLIIYISDNGIAFPGAKTTLYEPGMRLPCVIRNPYSKRKGIVNSALVTWADITPTILDFAGVLPEAYRAPSVEVKDPLPFNDSIPRNRFFHGRSFLPILDEEDPKGWDEIYAAHTFHEIYMYYPMRVVRERRFKLIWNIAYKLDYPFASDLYASKTWQAVLRRGETHYGKREVSSYIQRPEFELYDLENDPHEVHNLSDNPEYSSVLERMKNKLKAFQARTNDPWIMKWKYE